LPILNFNNNTVLKFGENKKCGGKVLFSGTPEALCKVKESFTAQFLKKETKIK